MFRLIYISAKDWPAICSIVLATVSFCSYWLLFVSDSFRVKVRAAWPGDNGIIRHVLWLKYAGLLILGVIPACLFLLANPAYDLSQIGLSVNVEALKHSTMWTLLLGLPALIFCWFTSRRSKTFAAYPQIRVTQWDKKLVVNYAMAWMIYMLGYEMLFRGILLFPLVNAYGVWPAVAINVMLYTTSHVPKGADETYATLLFGPLLCYITLETGSIWAAWLVHSCLAVGNSLTALYFHPEFTMVQRRPIAPAVLSTQS